MTTEQSDSRLIVSTSSLKKIGARPSLSDYIASIFDLLPFIVKRARLRSLSGGKGTWLGKTWLLLEPFCQIGIYFVIFGVLLKTDRGIENFVAYLAVGIIFFRKIQSSLSEGGSIIESNKGIIRAFPIPRASLVISDSIKKFNDLIPDIAALLIFISLVPPGVTPRQSWFYIIPISGLLIMFCAGISFVTARLSISIPDFKHIWPIIGRFWFYASGVIFSIDHFVTNPQIASYLKANPAYVFLDSLRVVILSGGGPSLAQWAQLIGWSTLLLVLGFIFFWRGEELFNRDL